MMGNANKILTLVVNGLLWDQARPRRPRAARPVLPRESRDPQDGRRMLCIASLRRPAMHPQRARPQRQCEMQHPPGRVAGVQRERRDESADSRKGPDAAGARGGGSTRR